jgi:hypothetical protein
MATGAYCGSYQPRDSAIVRCLEEYVSVRCNAAHHPSKRTTDKTRRLQHSCLFPLESNRTILVSIFTLGDIHFGNAQQITTLTARSGRFIRACHNPRDYELATPFEMQKRVFCFLPMCRLAS